LPAQDDVHRQNGWPREGLSWKGITRREISSRELIELSYISPWTAIEPLVNFSLYSTPCLKNDSTKTNITSNIRKSSRGKPSKSAEKIDFMNKMIPFDAHLSRRFLALTAFGKNAIVFHRALSSSCTPHCNDVDRSDRDKCWKSVFIS
jgi:hypothetical protein